MAPASGASNAKMHLQSRISYLHRAAAYLTDLQCEAPNATSVPQQVQTPDNKPPETSQGAHKSSGDPEKAQAKLTSLPPQAYNPQGIKLPKQPMIYPSLSPLARHLISDLQGISKKSVIRLQSSMKHTICKRCQSYLRPGHNMTTTVENKSRGGKKPWASVRVDTCSTCHAQKRFPTGAKRQPRRKDRGPKDPTARSEDSSKGKS